MCACLCMCMHACGECRFLSVLLAASDAHLVTCTRSQDNDGDLDLFITGSPWLFFQNRRTECSEPCHNGGTCNALGECSCAGAFARTKCDMECAAGTYCQFGEIFACGSNALYCPGQNYYPYPAEDGYHTRGGGDDGFNRTEQVVCPAGHYCTGGTAYGCPAGTWAPGGSEFVQLSDCLPCTAGRYGNETMQTSELCVDDCPPGYECPQGTAAPVPCLPGFTSSGGSGSCEPCLTGVALDQGSSECVACPAGKRSLSGVQCIDCAAGKASNVTGAAQCVLCAPGSYSETPGSKQCTPVGPGFFAQFNGSVHQAECDRGTFSDYEGATQVRVGVRLDCALYVY